MAFVRNESKDGTPNKRRNTSVNCSFAAPNRAAFTSIDAPYLSPARTGAGGRCRSNMGNHPFAYAPPDDGDYASLHAYHQQQQQQRQQRQQQQQQQRQQYIFTPAPCTLPHATVFTSPSPLQYLGTGKRLSIHARCRGVLQFTHFETTTSKISKLINFNRGLI